MVLGANAITCLAFLASASSLGWQMWAITLVCACVSFAYNLWSMVLSHWLMLSHHAKSSQLGLDGLDTSPSPLKDGVPVIHPMTDGACCKDQLENPNQSQTVEGPEVNIDGPYFMSSPKAVSWQIPRTMMRRRVPNRGGIPVRYKPIILHYAIAVVMFSGPSRVHLVRIISRNPEEMYCQRSHHRTGTIRCVRSLAEERSHSGGSF